MVINAEIGRFGSVGRCQDLLETEVNIVSRRKSEVLFHGRWLWTSENTVLQHQQMIRFPKNLLTVETSHQTLSNLDFVLLRSSCIQMKYKFYFHLKRQQTFFLLR